MVNILENVTCGNIGFSFSRQIPYIVKTIITVIKIVVPILLIVYGMLDLGKSVIAQKDDEIKKGQKTFIKRCVTAAIVFFIITIVELLVNLVAGDDTSSMKNCLKCFINNDANCTVVSDSDELITIPSSDPTVPPVQS